MKEPLFTAAGEALPALPWPDWTKRRSARPWPTGCCASRQPLRPLPQLFRKPL